MIHAGASIPSEGFNAEAVAAQTPGRSCASARTKARAVLRAKAKARRREEVKAETGPGEEKAQLPRLSPSSSPSAVRLQQIQDDSDEDMDSDDEDFEEGLPQGVSAAVLPPDFCWEYP